MLIRKAIRHHSQLSRRRIFKLIQTGLVRHGGKVCTDFRAECIHGDEVIYLLDGKEVIFTTNDNKPTSLYMLHKPREYVVARTDQYYATVYDLIPSELHHLHPIGRLDRMSTGLLLLTNDGQLTQSLEHPSAQVPKTYLVTLSHPWDPRVTATVLRPREISSYGDDGVTDILQLDTLEQLDEKTLRITIHSGAKRHIRRVLRSVDYYINTLQRISMGPYKLANLAPGDIQQLDIISID